MALEYFLHFRNGWNIEFSEEFKRQYKLRNEAVFDFYTSKKKKKKPVNIIILCKRIIRYCDIFM